MSTDPPELEQSAVTDEPPEGQPHVYNCECYECQMMFGNLPLLVEVIEAQTNSNMEHTDSTSLTSQSTTTNTEPTRPSTSSTTSSSLKIMKCPHCDKDFTHRGDFHKHVRKHTKEQPYVCRVCHRKFGQVSNLQRHLKIYTGDRPFVCSACNKRFSRKDRLDNHKKTKLCEKNSVKNRDPSKKTALEHS